MKAIAYRPYALPNLRALIGHPLPWRSPRDVAPIEWDCREELDYAAGLAALWPAAAQLFIIEHDIVPSDEVVAELLDCPEPLCTALYQLYPASTGLGGPVWAIWGTVPGLHFFRPGDVVPDFVPYSGLGMVKISRSFRDYYKSPPLAGVPWFDLDSRFAIWLGQLSPPMLWHVHRSEVRHLHS